MLAQELSTSCKSCTWTQWWKWNITLMPSQPCPKYTIKKSFAHWIVEHLIVFKACGVAAASSISLEITRIWADMSVLDALRDNCSWADNKLVIVVAISAVQSVSVMTCNWGQYVAVDGQQMRSSHWVIVFTRAELAWRKIRGAHRTFNASKN